MTRRYKPRTTGQSEGAWDKFFCATCQTERHIKYRTRFGHGMPRCTFCLERKSARAYENPKKVYLDYDEYERPSIPQDIVDAFRESRGE